MTLDDKTDEQILGQLREARNEQKRLKNLIGELETEWFKRLDMTLPERVFFCRKTALTTGECIKLGRYLGQSRNPGEIIEFVDSLLKERK